MSIPHTSLQHLETRALAKKDIHTYRTQTFANSVQTFANRAQMFTNRAQMFTNRAQTLHVWLLLPVKGNRNELPLTSLEFR